MATQPACNAPNAQSTVLAKKAARPLYSSPDFLWRVLELRFHSCRRKLILLDCSSPVSMFHQPRKSIAKSRIAAQTSNYPVLKAFIDLSTEEWTMPWDEA